MRWAGKQAIDHAEKSVKELEGNGKVEVAQSLEFSFVEFNELLALGYFEDDKINVSQQLVTSIFTTYKASSDDYPVA